MDFKKYIYYTFLIAAIGTLAFSCKKDPKPEPYVVDMSGTSTLPSYAQRTGNADSGYNYLVYGGYVNSGIPYDAYVAAMGSATPENVLGRTSFSANIPYNFNVVTAPNGIKVVSANCLNCHAAKLNGQFILGLGNSFSDYTADQSSNISTIDMLMNIYFPPDNQGNPSPEWVAYEPFRNAVIYTGPHIVTEKTGVNPADKLAAVLAAHRNNVDLTWSNTPSLAIPNEVIPSDTPPWWILKKKNTMFYTAVGRGDFARIMMASSILTLQDSSQARQVDNKFNDVLSYLNSIEAPAYPESINTELANEGEALFSERCAACHGTYGINESYPNIFVEISKIGTDSLLSLSNYAYNNFTDWYNNSWFAQSPYSAFLEAGYGYVAPPLDGIWASAPYFHNASVPNLEGVLNSSVRPNYWRRNFQYPVYDFEKVGWEFTEETADIDKFTYNTQLAGYGNSGHTFGDELSESERNSLIEYLKTL